MTDLLNPLLSPGIAASCLRPPKPPAAKGIHPTGGMGDKRSDAHGRPPHTGTQDRPVRVEPLPGPEPPTGPPPAFAANILETEQRRRQEGGPTDPEASSPRYRNDERAAGWNASAPPPAVDRRA